MSQDKDEILAMARKAGAVFDPQWGIASNTGTATFERFATLCRAPLVAEVERLNADMKQMGADLSAIQEIHSQQKAKLYADLHDLKTKLKAAEAELVRVRSGEPVAYIAWKNDKPCYEGDDAICEDAVWPVDSDDDRTSMPVFTAPQPAAQELTSAVPVVEQLVEALELVNKSDDDCDFMNTEAAARVGDAIEAGQKFIKENGK